MAAGVALLASFLAGSVPFAWIATRWRSGIDLRKVGSGNVGATNAGRVLGRTWFLFIFTLDALKGALPVLFLPDLPGIPPEWRLHVRLGCGLASILAHVFCPWLGFKGGKGVATGAGVVLALALFPSLAAFGAFVVTLAISRYMSLASCVGCAALGPAAWAFGEPREIVVFFTVVGAFVIFLHRPNLGRIAAGTEPKAFRKKEPQAQESSSG
jgi:acyl phosphate:glycerol-3-phosphate acyltransferase